MRGANPNNCRNPLIYIWFLSVRMHLYPLIIIGRITLIYYRYTDIRKRRWGRTNRILIRIYPFNYSIAAINHL